MAIHSERLGKPRTGIFGRTAGGPSHTVEDARHNGLRQRAGRAVRAKESSIAAEGELIQMSTMCTQESMGNDVKTLLLETLAYWLNVCVDGHRHLDEGDRRAAEDCLRQALTLQRNFEALSMRFSRRQ
jgi:hypothetical protein